MIGGSVGLNVCSTSDTWGQNPGPAESWKEWADCDSGVLIGRREAEAGEQLETPGLADLT